MLIKILAIVAVLAIISYFKAKVYFKWLILIFGICCLTEFLFVGGWLGKNIMYPKELSICEKENATIEQQITDKKEELLQGNINEERLDIILEEYWELKSKSVSNTKAIEEYQFWIQEGREFFESVIFLK